MTHITDDSKPRLPPQGKPQVIVPSPARQPPRRLDAFDFWWRSRLLVTARAVSETLRPSVRRWPVGEALTHAPVLAQRRTPLWLDGRDDEFELIAGKVQNLRIARPAFHAVEVPAGETWSFWRQLGRPCTSRGFVEGREIREGCIVPVLAGGICQISNALATAAVRAGFELVERHAHTARIEGGSTDEDVIDATVFWNYIDLRLRATHAWRLELELTATELIVTLRGHASIAPSPVMVQIPLVSERAHITAPPIARGCFTCDEKSCFRRRTLPAAPTAQERTVLLLDAWSPEFAAYLTETYAGAQRFVPMPMRIAFWRSVGPGWHGLRHRSYRAWWASARRAIWQRLCARQSGGRRQASLVSGQRWLAQAYAARLTPAHTKLVVAQALLPHLEQLGVLGGRQVEVLADALPIAVIEARLDLAARRWPQDASLRDYRAGHALAQAEQRALAQAECIVTAHADAAVQFPAFTQAPVVMLPWISGPKPVRSDAHRANTATPIIVFPASALARKGALELAAALQGLDCRLRVLGTKATLDETLWHRLDVEYCDWHGDGLADAAAVVLPAHVEHAPRALLRALAAGIPVVATSACGISAREGLHLVEAGDVNGLRAALQIWLNAKGSDRGAGDPIAPADAAR